MRLLLFILFIPFISFSQTKPQDQKPLRLSPVMTKVKCDKIHHQLNSIALTYPPCYDCECGRHLYFDLKTFMALELKYGDSLDKVVTKYMKDGSWYKGIRLIDAVEVDKLARKKYDSFQSSIDSMLKHATHAKDN